jgi:hypothetical protein
VCGLLVTVWVMWEVMLLCHFIRHEKAGSEGLILASSSRYCSASTTSFSMLGYSRPDGAACFQWQSYHLAQHCGQSLELCWNLALILASHHQGT